MGRYMPIDREKTLNLFAAYSPNDDGKTMDISWSFISEAEVLLSSLYIVAGQVNIEEYDVVSGKDSILMTDVLGEIFDPYRLSGFVGAGAALENERGEGVGVIRLYVDANTTVN